MTGDVITFYSYKGGTGRSLAVANVAWVLASSGKQVLVIDWDLEAPGLHRYFRPFLNDPDLASTKGLIDFIVECVFESAGNPSATVPSLLDFATALEWKFSSGGIDFVPAGRQDASYATRVNDFPWQKFYEHLGGRAILDGVREELKANYDYVLIDSRTGASDTSGICTIQMPDKLVLCFTMNQQSLQATASVAASVRSQRPPGSLQIFPVPMRVDVAEKEKLDAARQEARRQLDPFLDQRLLPTYWGDIEVPYQAFYSYDEALAPFIDAPQSRGTILASAENLARYLSGGAVHTPVSIPEDLRREVRGRLFPGSS
jgi:hypothetical protein